MKHSFDNESSQTERRQVLANDLRARREGATYYKLAQAELDAVGGRFAVARPKPMITGQVPPMSNGPWSESADLAGVEPALGYSVDDMPPVGEAHEAKAPPPPSSTPSDGEPREPDVSPASGSHLFRRAL
jgi:hypothetical protein